MKDLEIKFGKNENKIICFSYDVYSIWSLIYEYKEEISLIVVF